MTTYRAIQSFPLPHPKNPKRQILVRGGDEVELDDDQVADHAFGVTIERLDDDDAAEERDSEEVGAAPDAPTQGNESAGGGDEVELPARPGNGASTETWRNYLVQLGQVTESELGPLEIPADAKRDDMIVIGDQRVADWNEE